jgi:hypothetical protein
VYDGIILKFILTNRTARFGLYLWCMRGLGLCYFEHGNDMFSSIKSRQFFDTLSEHCSPKNCIVNGIIVCVIT